MATITSTEAGATGRYINLGSPASQDDIRAQTIIAYCKPTAAGGGGFAYLLGKMTGATPTGPRFFIRDSGSGPYISFGQDSTTTATAPNREGTLNEVTYGNWVHIGTTWDGSLNKTGIKLFVEKVESTYGTAGGSNGAGSLTSDASLDLFLMNRGPSGTLGREFVGDVAYVARWNRVLSTVEYDSAVDSGPLSVPSGLILCWANDQDYSTNAITATARSTRVTGSTPTNTALGGDVALTGQSYSYTQGTLAKSIEVAMAGQSFALSQGALSASTGSNVTLELSGQSYTLAQGAAAVALTKAVTGQSYTHSQGALNTMVLEGAYERSSVDLSGSSISGAGDSAVISILPKVQESEVATHGIAWLAPSVDVVGVNGFRPTFRFLAYKNSSGGNHGYSDGWPSTMRPMYSYDDGETWNYFDTNVTRDAGNEWIEFRHSTAFTGNKVRISRSRQVTLHQVGDWLAEQAAAYSSSFVPTAAAAAYTPSGSVADYAAQTFIADEFSTQTDSLGATVPVTPFYSAEINDTSLTPAGGGAKRLALIGCGVHAGEDPAWYTFKAFVAYLLGSSVAALAIRAEYKIKLYPCMNAPGKAGGAWRGSWTQGLAGADDINRHASDTDSTLEIVDKPKAVMTTDRAGTVPDWVIDFHSAYSGLWSYSEKPADAYHARWKAGMLGYGYTLADVGAPPDGSLETYWRNLGVKLVVTSEQGETNPVSDAAIVAYGETQLKVINDLMEEGAFFVIPAGVSYTHSQGAPDVGVTVALGGQSYAHSQGAFGVSTGGDVTVGLSGQVIDFTQGTLSKVTSVLATGQTYTFAQGGLSAAVSTGLTGQSYALTQGSVSASGGALPSGTVDLSPATINALAIAIADAIYAHPSALSGGAIATAVWAKTLP
ncbi:MAG: hypothetical protein WC023_01445 [Rhodocyclaceae bacterium]